VPYLLSIQVDKQTKRLKTATISACMPLSSRCFRSSATQETQLSST
jgi:hypothetical protein